MNSTIVTKFGGSSLSNSQQFIKVKKIMEANPDRRFLVPSAPGKGKKEKHKVTDLLLMCHQLASHKLHFGEIFSVVEDRYVGIERDLQLNSNIEAELKTIYTKIFNGASQDYCASRGEYLNGLLLADYLGFTFIDAFDVIFLDKGAVDFEKTAEVLAAKTTPDGYYVIPGFYGQNEKGNIKTLDRGGSDISGAIVAASINADLYENWTDVSGFLMADPQLVPNSKPIERVTYQELRELSYMGAPVLHEDAVFPVRNKKIPIQIKNTNQPDHPGTLILPDDEDGVQDTVVTGITGRTNYSVIRVEKTRMSEDYSFYRKLLSIFESNDIKIDHLPTSVDSISIVVRSTALDGIEKKLTEEISIYCNPDRIIISKGLAIIAVVGRGMINHKGTSALLFSALAKKGINIRMISQGSSEINIILGVSNEDFDDAVVAIYEAFEGSKK